MINDYSIIVTLGNIRELNHGRILSQCTGSTLLLNKILVIAWREVTRIRKQFGSRTSPFVVLVFMIVLGLSTFAIWNTLSLGSGLYQVGVAGDVPPIRDNRLC